MFLECVIYFLEYLGIYIISSLIDNPAIKISKYLTSFIYKEVFLKTTDVTICTKFFIVLIIWCYDGNVTILFLKIFILIFSNIYRIFLIFKVFQ